MNNMEIRFQDEDQAISVADDIQQAFPRASVKQSVRSVNVRFTSFFVSMERGILVLWLEGAPRGSPVEIPLDCISEFGEG